MGAKSGFALKLLQWFTRGIQFLTCALTLAIFSYFLALGSTRNVGLPIWVRAVEGIAGIGVIYTALGLLLLCCLAGHPFTSFFAIVLDIAFVGAFIYVAQANRGGAGTCRGNVNTPFGRHPDGEQVANQNPTYHVICQLQSAVLAVSIVAIIFFIISALLEFLLVRHRRRENRFGPSPANDYTSGYGKKGGLFSLFRRRKDHDEEAMNPNALPSHTQPDELRASYNTENTAVNSPGNQHYNKYGESGFEHDGHTAYPESHHESHSSHAPGTLNSHSNPYSNPQSNPYSGGYGNGTYTR